LLIREVLRNGLGSDRARRSFGRINGMHGRYRIANDDFLYVLSTFVTTPIEWLDQYGRRAMTEEEQRDWFIYWREFGARMGIGDLPDTLEDFNRFVKTYEAERFAPSPSNRRVAEPTIDLVLSMYYTPRFLFPFGRSVVMALCAPHLVKALGYDEPSPALRAIVRAAMRMRRAVWRMLPERTKVKEMPIGGKTYPEGYNIEELGTHPRTPADKGSSKSAA
jgi:hypothetical protein